MRSSTKSFPCSKTLAWTQKDLLLTGFIGSGVSEQGKHSNVQDIGQSRIRTGIVGLFFFFSFFFWKLENKIVSSQTSTHHNARNTQPSNISNILICKRNRIWDRIHLVYWYVHTRLVSSGDRADQTAPRKHIITSQSSPWSYLLSHFQHHTLILWETSLIRSNWNPRGGSEGRGLDINNVFPPGFENNFATWLTHFSLMFAR